MHNAPCLLLMFVQDALGGETLVTAPRATPAQTKSAADVVVVTSEELLRTGERSLPRALAKAAGPSVWMQETNTGGGSPMLRGLIGPHVLIVIDGVRLNDSTTRLGPNQSLNTIDPAIVERIEVIKGPSSVLYGSDAVGGAILIWTKRRAAGSANLRGVAGGFQGGLDTSYESASNGGRVSLELSDAGARDGFLAIGSVEQWNELRTGDGEVDFTGYDGHALFGSWDHAFDTHRQIRLSARLRRDTDVPRTDRLITGFGQTQPSNIVFDFVRQENAGVTLAFDDDESGALADRMQARVFLRHTREDRDIRATGSSTLRDESDVVQGYGVGVDWTKTAGDAHLLTWGLDFERDDVLESERIDVNVNTSVETPRPGSFAPNSHYASAGVFVQDEILAFDPFDVTLGLRYSYFDFSYNEFTATPAGGPEEDGDFDALTASLQVARDLCPELRLTGTLAQGFRAPHLDDLARNAVIFGGTELANPDLDPEQSLTGEIALDYHSGAWSVAFGVYHTGISDFIGRRLVDVGDPGQSGDETYLRENVGRVAIYGAELTLRRRLGSIESPFAIETGVAYTRGRQYDGTINPLSGIAEFDDVPARRIPPLNGLVSLIYEPLHTESALSWAEFQIVAAAEQDELNPEDLSDPRIDPDGTSGWVVLNLDVGGPLGAIGEDSRWSVGIHNILDEAYRVHGSGLDAPGFNVVAGLDWSF